MNRTRRWTALALVLGALGGPWILAAPAGADPERAVSREPVTIADPERGILLVFVQPGATVDAAFFETRIAAVEAVCRDLKVDLRVVEVDGSAPAEVRLTPLMVYQNWRGRSIYQGRTSTPERLRTFLRTVRRIPQGPGDRLAVDLLARESGRVTVAAPVKITGLAGVRPPAFDRTVFDAESRAALARGLTGYAWNDSVRMARADRSFYFDFYPHRSEDGRFSLGAALFSEFHCKNPVFDGTESPLSGAWEDRAEVFIQAAAQLAAATERAIADTAGGDGFTPVSEAWPPVSWESLGLELPPAPDRAGGRTRTEGDPGLRLPDEWTARDARSDEAPAVQFRFPAPLDRYTGEVVSVSGALRLGPNGGLQGAAGSFTVDVSAVTMGDEDLTATIHGPQFLNAGRFSTATLTIDEVSAGPGPLRFGILAPAEVRGTFTMKGRSIPVTLRAQAEAVLGEGGEPELLVSGGFQIRLADPFELEGPLEGVPPASDTLLLDFQIALVGS